MFLSYLSRLNKSSSSIAFSIFFQGCFSTLRRVLLWSALSSFLKPWWPKVGVRFPMSFGHFVCRNRSFTDNKPNLHTYLGGFVSPCICSGPHAVIGNHWRQLLLTHPAFRKANPSWLTYQENAATHLSCKSLLFVCLFSLPRILGQLL